MNERLLKWVFKQCEHEHDGFCAYGADCDKRTEHIERVYVPHKLERMVLDLQADMEQLRAENDAARDHWCSSHGCCGQDVRAEMDAAGGAR